MTQCTFPEALAACEVSDPRNDATPLKWTREREECVKSGDAWGLIDPRYMLRGQSGQCIATGIFATLVIVPARDQAMQMRQVIHGGVRESISRGIPTDTGRSLPKRVGRYAGTLRPRCSLTRKEAEIPRHRLGQPLRQRVSGRIAQPR